MSYSLEEWSPENTRWQELVQVITEYKQASALDSFFEQFPRYFLVALKEGNIVGFLMFVVWEMGPHDRGHNPIQVKGKTLTEANIIAFGVTLDQRRQGIGRALQEETIKRAKALGCYQVRSVSDDTHPENHQLKLAMGFAVEPMEREKPSLAFIMTLQ
jgi:GNAT superfamily N-acetyltransferase